MGFFRHLDVGVPTFKSVESRNLTWEDIAKQPRDDTVYAVLHCQSDWFRYEELVNEFVYQFKVTPASEMFVLPVQCFVGPLAVVPDLISPNNTSNDRFMAVLPRHKMGGFWKNYILSQDPYDFDPSEEQSDDDEEVDDDDEVDGDDDEADDYDSDGFEDGGDVFDDEIEDY